MSAVREATEFLAPVFDKTQLQANKETSLILRLSRCITSVTDENNVRIAVIHHTLGILGRIHDELHKRDTSEDALRLERPGERRTILALLDLVVLEGVYPALGTGVGIPVERRARSFVASAGAAKPRIEEVVEGPGTELLESILRTFLGILETSKRCVRERREPADEPLLRRHKGVEGIVRERCMVDIIAGCGQLAFGPDVAQSTRDEWNPKFEELMESIPTGTLMPLLMSLNHPPAPQWFRQQITKPLSLLPISRPHGVRSVLELFLSTASSNTPGSQSAERLSTDTLSKASRLILSVPKSLTPPQYFAKICPQLLDLLYCADPGLERAAAYVVAEILGKPGKEVQGMVERELVKKIISKLDPSFRTIDPSPSRGKVAAPSSATGAKASSKALLDLEDRPAPATATARSPFVVEVLEGEEVETEAEEVSAPLISESELASGVRSLEVLLSHPSPLVPRRILSPLLVFLWGLGNYAKFTGRNTWYSRVFNLLKSYFAVALNLRVLTKLQDNILFNGGQEWRYCPGSSGGIEIRRSNESASALDVDLIDDRIGEFLSILEGDARVGVLNDYFLHIFREWLARSERIEPVKMLVTVKILQSMLTVHGETLAKKPTEMLQVIHTVLGEYVSYIQGPRTPKVGGSADAPKIAVLGQIAQDTVEDIPIPDEDGYIPESTHQAETASMALSLLSVLVSNPETKLTPADERLITALHPPLTYLSNTPNIERNVSTLATNLVALLASHTPATGTSTTTPTTLSEAQRGQYATALSYLRDPLIPVRAHGLYLLRSLILARAPVVDATNTARLLIGMIKDGDSYVYINVIKCLSALTDRHSRTVTKMLVEAYIDEENVNGVSGGGGKAPATLDERLRVGEALLATVQRLGKALVGETAKEVAETMITIVSRRRVRGSGNAPQAPPTEKGDEEGELLDEDGNVLTPEQRAQHAVKAQIVSGWSSAPRAEDLRIRASALSILGAAVETNPTGLGERLLHESITVSTSILTLETKLEAGILRRAAVVCLGAVLKGLVREDEEDLQGTTWRRDVWKVLRERVAEVGRLLGYVAATDNDGLVREQARAVGENLEAVKERAMVGGRGMVDATPVLGVA